MLREGNAIPNPNPHKRRKPRAICPALRLDFAQCATVPVPPPKNSGGLIALASRSGKMPLPTLASSGISSLARAPAHLAALPRLALPPLSATPASGWPLPLLGSSVTSSLTGASSLLLPAEEAPCLATSGGGSG